MVHKNEQEGVNMKSITIHGLSDELDQLIREKANKQNTSLNKTIKQLLEDSLGINKEKRTDHRKDFKDLCGVWTRQDVKEFEAATREFNQVDQRDWS